MNASSIDGLLAHEHLIRALARELLHDEQSVDDVVQDTWLVAIQREPARSESLASWLARIARNFALRTLRGSARRRHRESATAAFEVVPSTEQILEREETRRLVVRAVLRLPEPHRGVTVLRYFEGWPPRAIAKRLGVPVETVRSRLKRARAELRLALAADHGEGGSLARRLGALAAGGWSPWGASLGTSSLVGALLMTAKLKISIAAVVLLVAAASIALWSLGDREPGSRPPAGEPPAIASPARALASDAQVAAPAVAADGAAARRTAIAPEPPSVAPPPATGSLLVRAQWKESRAAAADVPVMLREEGGPSSYFHARTGTTGEDGTLRFTELPPGKFQVSRQLDVGVSAAIRPGAETAVVLELPSGMTIDGLVVDGAGQPVGDAAITVASGGTEPRMEPAIVARTAADGTFHLTGVQDGDEIGARASGHAPSYLHWLFASQGGKERRLRLVLDQPGGDVAGEVHDRDGKPVANALVRVRLGEFEGYRPRDGSSVGKPLDLWARSDEDGFFTVASVPARTLPVEARAEGFGVWRGTVEASLQVTTQLEVVLERSSVVRGTVVTADGKPAARIRIRVGRDADLMSATASSDAAGRFRLPEVPSGEVAIVADGEELGQAAATLHVQPGEEVVWDAVLSRGREIKVRVLDDADQPLAACKVELFTMRREDSDDGHYHGFGFTDASGRFAMPNVKEIAHAIHVYAPNSDVRALRREDVRPGPDELVFRIGREQMPTALITGRVVDVEGNPLGGVRVTAYAEDRMGAAAAAPRATARPAGSRSRSSQRPATACGSRSPVCPSGSRDPMTSRRTRAGTRARSACRSVDRWSCT
ncbi:MAG: sigma-70 family RNA polymerase sigma factor [Planctomycetota bacterium]